MGAEDSMLNLWVFYLYFRNPHGSIGGHAIILYFESLGDRRGRVGLKYVLFYFLSNHGSRGSYVRVRDDGKVAVFYIQHVVYTQSVSFCLAVCMYCVYR